MTQAKGVQGIPPPPDITHMNPKLLHDWSDGILVVVGPGRDALATWACPLCHSRFDGVAVHSSEKSAIGLARLAFEVHLTSKHAECIEAKPATETLEMSLPAKL